MLTCLKVADFLAAQKKLSGRPFSQRMDVTGRFRIVYRAVFQHLLCNEFEQPKSRVTVA